MHGKPNQVNPQGFIWMFFVVVVVVEMLSLVVYFLPVAGMPSLLTVMLSRRMFGLSYSSMDMPRDRRRGPLLPSFELLELVEYARVRSTPGMATDVNKP